MDTGTEARVGPGADALIGAIATALSQPTAEHARLVAEILSPIDDLMGALTDGQCALAADAIYAALGELGELDDTGPA
jgi:hypothetical protein